MKIEISNGELVDKFTILLIKQEKINDSVKLMNIKNELKEINPFVDSLNLDTVVIDELKNINSILWKIEDDIREKEKLQLFDEEFIELARQVYKTNTLRFKLKQKINNITNSYLKEEKSH